MTELPDFTGYEPVELSQLKPGDVVAAVLAGTIAHGTVAYSRNNSVDLDCGFNTTDKGDYKFFKAPKLLPTGECAVIEYEDGAGVRCRATLMDSAWFSFEVNSSSLWAYVTDLSVEDLKADIADGFTVIFEGVKK